MSLQTVTVRNFLHKLRGTGSLYECHSKHPPTSRLLWKRHKQWDFSILLTRFFFSLVPSFSGMPQSGIYQNTCEFSVGEVQKAVAQHLCPGACWGIWTFLLNGPRMSNSSFVVALTMQSTEKAANIVTRIIPRVVKLMIPICLTAFPVLVHCRKSLLLSTALAAISPSWFALHFIFHSIFRLSATIKRALPLAILNIAA